MGTNFTKTGFLIGLILYINQLSNAQQVNLPPAPIKWGKVSDAEFAIKECSYEKEAKGVVLCDYGKLLIYPAHPITIRYHKRIKILKEEGLDLANISLPYYVKNNFEKISSIRAQTINTDPNGNPVSKQVENKQFFDNPKDEYYREIRFTFPDVKVGSILEYEYTLISQNYYFLEGWVFQDEIPTLYSEFVTGISEKYLYDVLLNGLRLTKKYGSATDAANQWILTNLPSLKDEPFVWNNQDYAEKILFQLSAYQKNSSLVSGYEEVLNDWEGIVKEVMEQESMVNFLYKPEKITNILEGLNLKTQNNTDKLKSIYDYVNRNFNWNGDFRIIPSKTLKDLLTSRTGSSADLNLLMFLLLKEAGIEAYPALISTKTHGLPLKKIAFLNQFNHLICAVNMDNQITLLDARASFHPYNLLERMDLNVAAFLLDKQNPRWIDITPPGNSHRNIYITHDLTKTREGEKQGSLIIKFDGYYAVSQRKLLNDKGKDEYIQSELNTEVLGVKDVQFKNLSDFEQALVLEAELYNKQALGEDVIYFNPIYLDFYQDNPFKSDERFFPVDLIHPDKDSYVITLTIPNEYEVIEIPKELQIKLPDDGGTYLFSAKLMGNTIQISSRMTLNRYFFLIEEYPYLKEFFDQIRAKHAEQIVLKKKP